MSHYCVDRARGTLCRCPYLTADGGFCEDMSRAANPDAPCAVLVADEVATFWKIGQASEEKYTRDLAENRTRFESLKEEEEQRHHDAVTALRLEHQIRRAAIRKAYDKAHADAWEALSGEARQRVNAELIERDAKRPSSSDEGPW